MLLSGPADYGGLIRQALAVRENAYAPYSGFMVGAALLTPEGEVFTGCNVENAAFSPTNCAERSAFFRAVSAGRRRFTAIAVVGAARGTGEGDFREIFPCGLCRQVMAEFCAEDFAVVTGRSPGDYRVHTLKELLPQAFGPGNLKTPGNLL